MIYNRIHRCCTATLRSGCFTIFASKSNNYRSGWEVKVSYQINIHKKDLLLLKQIQSYFGVGSISKQGEFKNQYRVQSIKDMVSVIKHFDNYPLLSEKYIDYGLIKKAFNIIYNKVSGGVWRRLKRAGPLPRSNI